MRERLGFIDTVRGLILVLMALDHTSVFWNKGRVAWEGLPVFRDGILFFNYPVTESFAQHVTRFVTHICAPGFIFLAGTMIAFSSALKDTDEVGRKKFSGHLLERGMIFVLLEVTLIQLIWGYNMFIHPPPAMGTFIYINFGIISLFGFLFIILSFLRRMPTLPMMAFCVLLLVGYRAIFPSLALWTYEAHSNLLLGVAPIVYLPVEFGRHSITTGIYPIFPWISVVLLGLLFGRLLYRLQSEGRMQDLMRYTLVLGIGLIVLSVFYGLLAESRLSKYPPSLGFLTLTLGTVLLLLAIAQFLEKRGKTNNILVTFGRVPFFFYIIHLLLYSLIPSITGTYAGFSLPTTYIVWLCGLPILYFLCRWYYDFKTRHKSSFLRYF